MAERITETDLHEQITMLNIMVCDTLVLDIANGGVALARDLPKGQETILPRTRRPNLYAQIQAMMVGIQLNREE